MRFCGIHFVPFLSDLRCQGGGRQLTDGLKMQSTHYRTELIDVNYVTAGCA